MSKKGKTVQLATVWWKDATMHGHAQYDYEEAKRLRLSTGFAAGIVAHEDKEKITLAMEMFSDGSKGWRHLVSIPKSGVTHIDRFAYKRRKS